LQIISTNYNGALHLGGDDKSLQDTTTDGNVSSEGAFLVNIRSLNSFLGGLETQTNTLVVSGSLLGLLAKNSLTTDENTVLLLVSLLVLLCFTKLDITVSLKDAEDLLDVQSLVGGREVLNHVELHSLGQRSALTDGNNITFRHVLEGRRAVDRHVVVSLGKTSVL